MNLRERLDGSYCTLYFDNFFNSLMLVNKLYGKGIYCAGTVRRERVDIAIVPNDNEIKRGDIDFQAAVKWFDNPSRNSS